MEKRDWQLINECINMLKSTLGNMEVSRADALVSSVVTILEIVIKTTDKK